MFLFSLFFAALFSEPSLQEYTIRVEGMVCYAYSYSDMNEEKPLLLFVHGSPGDYMAWDKYLKDSSLQSKYRILALDRPGYRKSIQENILAFPKLDFQAKVVRRFVRKYAHQQPIILVGHSVGGPIVTHYAMNFSDEIKTLILLAPAISARNEQPRWYNRMAQKNWIRKKLKKDMLISQEEMMNLPPQLDEMQPNLNKITCETWLLHGRLDMIAPYPNALYVKKNFTNTKIHFIKYPFQNHFLPWTKFDDIKTILLEKI